MTSTKKNDVVVSNNRQNVTVGTLADAQKQDMRKSDKGNTRDRNGAQKDRYVYCDFAQIEEEEYDVDYEIDQEGLLEALDESTTMAAAQTLQHQSISYLQQPPPVLRASGWVRSQRFPTKLYALLSQPQLSGIITWMPHGRSWKVLKPRLFETSVLPVFFESDNYHSFNRVINAWSFRRKSTGPDRGSYFHELFLRGKPHLQKYMRRLPRTHKKLAMAKTEEPDFFELQKNSPLPTLEQARLNLESRKFMRLRDQYQKDPIVQGIIPDGTRSQLAISPEETTTPDAKKDINLKHLEAWREDQSNIALTTLPIVPLRKQDTEERINQFGLGIKRGTSNQNMMKLPGTLFQIQQDELLKDDLDMQSRMSGHSLLQQPQQQQQEQARAIQLKTVMMRQQEHQLLARHHQSQMMQHMEQEHILQARLVQQQRNQMNLLRQIDFLQKQRTGF